MVLVSYLQDLQRRIHGFVEEAIDAPELDVCTSNLRSLSNEIHHLGELIMEMTAGVSDREERRNRLISVMFELKQTLTSTGAVAEDEARERARQVGNRLRKHVLETLFVICESKKDWLG